MLTTWFSQVVQSTSMKSFFQVRDLERSREDYPIQEHCWLRNVSLSGKVWRPTYCQRIGFKNGRSNNYVLSSSEDVSKILEADYCLVAEFPQAGEGYVNKGAHYWCLETFSDSDWRGNKSHSGGFHALNSCPLFNSSRPQKILSLSSCEAEFHATVSSASDGIYIRSVLAFPLRTKVDRYIFTDSSSARQLVMKRGFGKVRHLDGKLL